MSHSAERHSGAKPWVSVVLPVFNARATIRTAVESVLSQTMRHWELIIVDDGSTDDSLAIVQAYAKQDPRIVVIASDLGSGSPARPRNIAMDNSSGCYLAFLDADDLWQPTKLELQLRYMAEQDVDLCGTWVNLINKKGDKIGSRKPRVDICYESLLRHNTLSCSSVMCRVSDTKKISFPLVGHEDYALWLSLLRSGVKAAVMPQLLSSYRVHAQSVSANKLKMIVNFWVIYHTLQGFSRARSVYYTLRYLLTAMLRR